MTTETAVGIYLGEVMPHIVTEGDSTILIRPTCPPGRIIHEREIVIGGLLSINS